MPIMLVIKVLISAHKTRKINIFLHWLMPGEDPPIIFITILGLVRRLQEPSVRYVWGFVSIALVVSTNAFSVERDGILRCLYYHRFDCCPYCLIFPLLKKMVY